MRQLTAAFLMLCACSWTHAQLWGYIDDKGVGHFASTKVDERYELFSLANLATENLGSDPNSQRSADLGSDPNLPSASTQKLTPKLAAFFEKSATLKAIKPMLDAASKQYNIDVSLLQALITTESGLNPTAVSPKGALGLMQLMPSTAALYGVKADKAHTQQQKLFDPQINITTGTRHLRDLMNLYAGKLDLVLAAYNAGAGAVAKAGNKIPNYPETQNYVLTVTQIYNALKPPAPAPSLPKLEPSPLATQAEKPKLRDPLAPTLGRRNGI